MCQSYDSLVSVIVDRIWKMATQQRRKYQNSRCQAPNLVRMDVVSNQILWYSIENSVKTRRWSAPLQQNDRERSGLFCRKEQVNAKYSFLIFFDVKSALVIAMTKGSLWLSMVLMASTYFRDLNALNALNAFVQIDIVLYFELSLILSHSRSFSRICILQTVCSFTPSSAAMTNTMRSETWK